MIASDDDDDDDDDLGVENGKLQFCIYILWMECRQVESLIG